MRAPNLDRLRRLERVHLAETATAAAYGTMLLLAALVATDSQDVASGSGFELVVEVGLATYVAHVFAHVIGAQLLHAQRRHGDLVRTGLVYGSPILLVTMLPALALGLGVSGTLSDTAALRIAVAIGLAELLLVGALTGALVDPRPARPWIYTAVVAGFGVAVVVVKLTITH